MKLRKHRPITIGLSDADREHDVQQEIETFLAALSSYPDRFARNPYLSFEQHLCSIASAKLVVGEPHRNSGPE